MTIRRNIARLAATTVVAGTVLTAGFAPSAFAADNTDVTVTGGTLGITVDPTVGDFAGVTLDGTAKTTTATLDGFEVNDATGTGAGWNVTVQASQFAEWDGDAYVPDGKTLAENSLSMAAPTVAADGTTSAVPTVTSGPYTIDAASAVKIASAAADTGMGRYDFTQTAPLTLSIPTDAYAKVYRSTVTVSTVTGP